MKEELWVEVQEAFAEAVKLPPEARKLFLDETCGNRPDVRLEVESLLAYQPAAERLDQSAIVLAAAEMFTDHQITDDDAGPIGTVVAGKYLVRERLGEGGMAEVYLADHLTLKVPFAIKCLKPVLRSDPEFRKGFLEEAQRAVILKHDNVARLHDVIEAGDDIFVVMEYIEGETLRDRLAALARPLTVDEFLPIALQCASGLAAAHEKRIIHLDVKPENIMLTPAGQVKICDFGVGRRLPGDLSAAATTEMSGAGQMLAGTPAYMAPEVFVSHPVDERADQFSLGIVFYEMLAGHNPFTADSLAATARRIASDTPLPLSSVRDDIAPRLERIVARMLAKHPNQRYTAARDLVRELRAIEQFGKAIELAKQELSINPCSAAVHLMLARYYAMLGNRAAAFSHLHIALQKRPKDAEYQFIAAIVHNHFGERAAAIRFLENAIDFGYRVAEIQAERELDKLRGDPRFRALIAGQAVRRAAVVQEKNTAGESAQAAERARKWKRIVRVRFKVDEVNGQYRITTDFGNPDYETNSNHPHEGSSLAQQERLESPGYATISNQLDVEGLKDLERAQEQAEANWNRRKNAPAPANQIPANERVRTDDYRKEPSYIHAGIHLLFRTRDEIEWFCDQHINFRIDISPDPELYLPQEELAQNMPLSIRELRGHTAPHDWHNPFEKNFPLYCVNGDGIRSGALKRGADGLAHPLVKAQQYYKFSATVLGANDITLDPHIECHDW